MEKHCRKKNVNCKLYFVPLKWIEPIDGNEGWDVDAVSDLVVEYYMLCLVTMLYWSYKIFTGDELATTHWPQLFGR